ncbi:MAG: KpsF/GutQ family sugar-phosphate isomerase [Saprospiraceae bacterium]|nr:KpsF/GutQ family sugar-phosphate isomerase [Saprospiraceae bacterium]
MLSNDQKEEIIRLASDCIRIESKAVHDLLDQLNDAFVGAVHLIFQSKGRLVITGIGKSAIVGQKIVATMNSTGTPSLFMHAADAIHGDLGMIQSEDVVICLSKSGETTEIKALVPLIKARNIQLISITAHSNSYLALQSDHCLLTPISQEAEPNNLAPTASTTAQMAMGDALAVGLLSLRGFSPEDFAKYHPGGALGKQLYLRVSDFYLQHKTPKVSPDDTVQKVLITISSGRMGATAVVDHDGLLMGIITDGDLRRFFEKSGDILRSKASDLMNHHPKCIEPDELAVQAFRLMQDHSISQLIVSNENKYLGMVHIHDLIKEGIV